MCRDLHSMRWTRPLKGMHGGSRRLAAARRARTARAAAASSVGCIGRRVDAGARHRVLGLLCGKEGGPVGEGGGCAGLAGPRGSQGIARVCLRRGQNDSPSVRSVARLALIAAASRPDAAAPCQNVLNAIAQDMSHSLQIQVYSMSRAPSQLDDEELYPEGKRQKKTLMGQKDTSLPLVPVAAWATAGRSGPRAAPATSARRRQPHAPEAAWRHMQQEALPLTSCSLRL
jgi:hypothetical protein